jgi:hypothetical protein
MVLGRPTEWDGTGCFPGERSDKNIRHGDLPTLIWHQKLIIITVSLRVTTLSTILLTPPSGYSSLVNFISAGDCFVG